MKFPHRMIPLLFLGLLGCATSSPTNDQTYIPPPTPEPGIYSGYRLDRYNEFNRSIQTYQPGATPCNTVPDGTGGFRTYCQH